MKPTFKIKKLFVTTGIVTSLVVLSLATSVYAMTSTGSAALAQTQQRRMDNLKTRADNEINRRVTDLNDLISRINSMKHLSAANKTAFMNSIQTEIRSLNSLKAKVDADTDVTTLKADVQSIVTEYRVFLLYIPQIQLLSSADRMNDIAGKLNDLATKLQTRINTNQAAGKDVSALETLLKDMVAKIADANTQYNNIETTIITLLPKDYPGNRGALLSARKMIQTGHLDLVTSLQDGQKIIQGLKALYNTSTSSTKK